MVNKYQEQSNYHQQRPTAMANIFHLSEHLINIMFIDNNYTSNQDAQKNLSIIVNYYGIILEVKIHDRGSVRNGPHQQPTRYRHLNTS